MTLTTEPLAAYQPMAGPLFVWRYGRAGPLVVLLHGLGASGRLWRPTAERLAGEALLVCPDLLGFGRSPKPHVAYSVADHLLALNAMLDRFVTAEEPVILAGTSGGAVLALEWAAAHPGRFCGLALSALPAYRSPAEAQASIATAGALAWATVRHPDLGERLCSVMCAGRPLWRALMPLLMPGVPSDIAHDMVLHTWTSYSGTVENVLVHHRIAPAAAQLVGHQIPVRLLHGDRYREAPLAAVHELADMCGWPLTVLAEKGHRLPLEAPAACAAELRTLLPLVSRIR
jgi:pimeloyl-ACP methyl ester carboxylesterase